MNRIPSLDGFRAISILLVIFAHCRFIEGFPPFLIDFARQCDVGVIVFFVISGLLITTLLLKEYEKMNTISIKDFFIKRSFRILPVFLLYIGFIMIYNRHFDLELTFSNLLHAITFTTNYDYNSNWFLGHFWTLSIEEQFYLFWPIVLLLFRKNLKLCVILLIGYSCLIRVLVYRFQLNPTLTLHPFFFKSDAILVGAFSAIIHHEYPTFLQKKIFNNYFLQAFALSLILIFVYASSHGKLAIIALPFGNTIISISIIYLIISYIHEQNNYIFKFLNHKFIIHIGMLSYSIYIWQQFFFNSNLGILSQLPYTLLAIYMVSLSSYYLWEKPFIKMRELFLTQTT